MRRKQAQQRAFGLPGCAPAAHHKAQMPQKSSRQGARGRSAFAGTGTLDVELWSQYERLDRRNAMVKRLLGEGPLAFFRNQSNVALFLVDLMEIHYGLGEEPAIVPLRNIQTATEDYPRKQLVEFLSSRAPQL